MTPFTNTIQNIHLDISTRRPTTHLGRNLIRFARSSIIRGTLSVILIDDAPSTWRAANLLVSFDLFMNQQIRRFTNFRTVQWYISRNGDIDRLSDALEYLEADLVATFGPAEYTISDGNGLRFNPVDHSNRLRLGRQSNDSN